jgi:hypothetical protein
MMASFILYDDHDEIMGAGAGIRHAAQSLLFSRDGVILSGGAWHVKRD